MLTELEFVQERRQCHSQQSVSRLVHTARTDGLLMRLIEEVMRKRQLDKAALLGSAWSEVAPTEVEKYPLLQKLIALEHQEASSTVPTNIALASPPGTPRQEAWDPSSETAAKPGESSSSAPGGLRKRASGVRRSFSGTPTPAKSQLLAARFELIKRLNSELLHCLPHLDLLPSVADDYCMQTNPESSSWYRWGLGEKLGRARAYILSCVKSLLIDAAMVATDTPNENSAKFELVISRSRAANRILKGECDNEGRWSVFGQAFRRIHGMPPASLRRVGQLWVVVFSGERAHDSGGPYRESWSVMSQELMSGALPLLLQCPNGKALVGSFRETWILNPDSTLPTQIEMFNFLGKLMGMAIRTKGYLELTLAPIVWKHIAREEITLEDLRDIDQLEVSRIERLRKYIPLLSPTRPDRSATESKDSEAALSLALWEDEVYGLEFTAISLGGSVAPLHHGGRGEAVSRQNFDRYCDELERFRLSELKAVAAAVRAGLATQVPPVLLHLLRWDELETLTCGEASVNLDLLQAVTEYANGYNAEDEVIKWFWCILREDCTQVDLRAFLRFTWGRSRLPLTEAGFTQRLKIQCLSKGPADRYLPVSHTCFFSVELPRYSTREILRDRLLYAVHNCSAIDGDDTSVGIRAAAMGWEDM